MSFFERRARAPKDLYTFGKRAPHTIYYTIRKRALVRKASASRRAISFNIISSLQTKVVRPQHIIFLHETSGRWGLKRRLFDTSTFVDHCERVETWIATIHVSKRVWFSKRLKIMKQNSSTQTEENSSKLAPKQMKWDFFAGTSI